MQRLVLVVSLGSLLALLVAPAAAFARAAGDGASPPRGAPAAAMPSPLVDPEPMAIASKPRKPAGMWGGTRPARGGAYRYPYLVVGAGAAALSGVIMVTYLRRISRSRQS